MLKTQTTLILGAGASQPYGYPLGKGLRNKLLEESGNITSLLQAVGVHYSKWVTVRRALLASQFDTVDEFMARFPEHAELTKLVVTYWINFAESMEALLDPRKPDHWYRPLVSRVLGDDPALGHGLLSIVTFNYDVSLEAYLYEVLTNRYRVTADQARTCLQNLQITHIYGSLGPLLSVSGAGRAYGPIESAEGCRDASQRVGTCFDKDSDAAGVARRLINQSEDVLFLGFGYSKENLARLRFGDSLRRGARVRGCTYGCAPGYEAALAEHMDVTSFKRCSVPDGEPAIKALELLFPE